MRKQETLARTCEAIVTDLNRNNIGLHLRDIYTHYSDVKLWHYNRCYNSIQVGARNIEYGVYSCGSWSFVFLARYDIESKEADGTRHSLTVYRRFTRDTETCIVYDWNDHKYYDAVSANSYFELKNSKDYVQWLHLSI